MGQNMRMWVWLDGGVWTTKFIKYMTITQQQHFLINELMPMACPFVCLFLFFFLLPCVHGVYDEHTIYI